MDELTEGKDVGKGVEMDIGSDVGVPLNGIEDVKTAEGTMEGDTVRFAVGAVDGFTEGEDFGKGVEIDIGSEVGVPLIRKPPGVLHCPIGLFSSGAIHCAKKAFFGKHCAPGSQQVFTVMQLP